MFFLSIIKLNHWFNARKLTIGFFKKKNNNLYKKLLKNKNFNCSAYELKFLCNKKSYREDAIIDIISKTKKKYPCKNIMSVLSI